MKICPNCSYENSDDKKYCCNCGANLLANPSYFKKEENTHNETVNNKPTPSSTKTNTPKINNKYNRSRLITCPCCKEVYEINESKCPYCGAKILVRNSPVKTRKKIPYDDTPGDFDLNKYEKNFPAGDFDSEERRVKYTKATKFELIKEFLAELFDSLFDWRWRR